jgi:hypothetical protein
VNLANDRSEDTGCTLSELSMTHVEAHFWNGLRWKTCGSGGVRLANKLEKDEISVIRYRKLEHT